MELAQPGILEEETRLARSLMFTLLSDTDPRDTLLALREQVDGKEVIAGLGSSLLLALDASLPGMRTFPALAGKGVEVPATHASLWIWLRGDDRGKVLHRGRQLTELLSADFELTSIVDAFQYDGNRDLSGYEDGTENPKGDDARGAAIVTGQGAGRDGGSFVAVQQWVHDLDYMESLSQAEQDDIIGRHRSNNEEFDEAPESAHVKRAAQESFDPEAFILRRSMPWTDGASEGLIFIAFGKSFDAFEAILNRMVGHEDGITDNLFRFTRPVTGSYFWCPPMKSGALDLSAVGL